MLQEVTNGALPATIHRVNSLKVEKPRMTAPCGLPDRSLVAFSRQLINSSPQPRLPNATNGLRRHHPHLRHNRPFSPLGPQAHGDALQKRRDFLAKGVESAERVVGG